MRLLRHIGGPNAVTRWSFILTAVMVLIPTAVPTSRDALIGSLAERMAVATAGLAAAALVLGLGWLTVLGSSPRSSRPAAAIVVFALAGVANALAVLAMRKALDEEPVGAAVMIITRGASAAVWLSAVAIVVDQTRRHRARMAELREAVRERRAALDAEREELAEVGARLGDEVVAPLCAALDDISARIAAHTDGSPVRAEAEAVRRLVDDRVRPLGRQLLAADEVPAPVVAETRRDPGRTRSVLRLAASTLAAPTWLAVATPLVIVVLFAPQRAGGAFIAGASATYVVLMTLLFATMRRLLGSVLPRLPWPRALAVVLVTYEAMAALAMLNMYVWSGVSGFGRWVEWTQLIVLPVIWMALAAAGAAAQGRRRAELQLEEVLAELRVITARRRQQLRHAYQALGRVLHGEVQGALLGVSERLAELDSAEPDEREAVLRDAVRVLQAVRAEVLQRAVEDWTTEKALAALVNLWRGALEVRLEVPREVLDRLDADPPAGSVVIDVVAEGLTNAMRHGAATCAGVGIHLAPIGCGVVTVTDDGSGPSGGEPGMGSRLLDTVAVEWSLARSDGITTLRVVVPLTAAGVPGPVNGGDDRTSAPKAAR